MPRLALWCAGLLVAALWYRSQDPAVPAALVAGSVYDVPTTAGVTEFDLPFATAGQSYLLALGNLSHDVAPRSITVTAEPVARCQLRPWQLWTMPASPVVPPSGSGETAAAALTPPQPNRRPAAQRQVWLTVTGAMTHAPPVYRPIDARLRSQGQYVDVYVDHDDRVADQLPQAIAAAYDKLILPTVARHLGAPIDVDGSGALTIVVTGWLDRLEAGQTALGGMVRPADYDPRGRAPHSNASDVVFLSAGLRPGRHMETLLAHELAHAVSAGARYAQSGWLGPAYEQPWHSEGLAHVTEDLAGRGWSNLDYRVAAFLACPETAPLVVSEADAPRWARAPGCRGNTFLFHRWCCTERGGHALREMAAGNSCGTANLEQTMACPLDDLFRGYWLQLAGALPARPKSNGAAALSHLDLTERIGAHRLSGPCTTDWNVSLANQRWSCDVAGTAVSLLRLHSEQAGAYRIRVVAPENDWQVSLAPLAVDRPQLRLVARAVSSGQMQLTLKANSSSPLKLEHVAWESVGGATRAAANGHGSLTGDELSRLFDTLQVSSVGPLVSQAIHVPAIDGGRLRMHAVATDATGQRYAAWVEHHVTERPVAALAQRLARREQARP